MKESEFILVFAPIKTGEQFIHHLKHKNLPFVVVTNNENEQLKLSKLGVDHLILLDTEDQERPGQLPNIQSEKSFYLKILCPYAVVIFKSSGSGPQRRSMS